MTVSFSGIMKPNENSNPADSHSKSSSKEVELGSVSTELLCSFGVVTVAYLFGYYNVSVAWLLGPLLVYHIQAKRRKLRELIRNSRRTAANFPQKDLILSKFGDIPSWVSFPDVERLEWFNEILRQLWPSINSYSSALDRKLQKNFEKSKIKFKNIELGTIPPRIDGIKVYDKDTSRKEIIIDLDVQYAGDVSIWFTVGVFKGGLKDFIFNGKIRLVLKPLVDHIPFIGGVQMYFLQKPNLDFALDGVVDYFDITGLSEMINDKIMKRLCAHMVLPNKLSLQISNKVSTHVYKFPEPRGVLRVHLVEGKDLMKKDFGVLGKGKSDPYAILALDAEQVLKSNMIPDTVAPKWDYWCEFFIETTSGQHLTAYIYDKDNTGKDESLGRATVDVHQVIEKGQVDRWLTLEEATTGMIHLRMVWFEFSSCVADLESAVCETQMLRVATISTCVLMVYIDSAKHLPKIAGKSGIVQPDPKFYISVGRTQYKSKTCKGTDSPVYEQGFTFLVNNPEVDTLQMKFVDKSTGTDLGKVVYDLSGLMSEENLELLNFSTHVKNACVETKVILGLRLRILKYSGGATDDESDDVFLEHAELSALKDVDRKSCVKKTSREYEEMVNSEIPAGTAPEHTEKVTLNEAATAETTSPMQPLDNRFRSSSSSLTDSPLGKIHLTMKYSVPRQRFIVIVHRIANLPRKDLSNIPDPFVKLYLLPERAKETKRKTMTIKDDCDPVYDEKFEYVMSQTELNHKQLEVTVLTHKKWKSPVMGQVIINLPELDLSKGVTAWYDLLPDSQREKEQ